MEKIDEDNETITIEVTNMADFLTWVHDNKEKVNLSDKFITMFRKPNVKEKEMQERRTRLLRN